MSEPVVVALLVQAALDSNAKNIAFMDAKAHPLLPSLAKQSEQLCLMQTNKADCNDLKMLGLDVSFLHGLYDLILLVPSKDKKQSLAWMAQAFEHLTDHGKLIVVCENQYGAKSYETALKKLAGYVASSSKSKCRIFSAKKTSTLNIELQQQWLDDALPKVMESHGLWAQAGLFSWKSADVGSSLLLEYLPKFSGKGMDLCCGYGLLSVDVLNGSDAITLLHLVESEALALDCARKNIADFSSVSFHHLDAAMELLPKHLNFVVCNPPFHKGQTRDIELGQTIINKACGALTHGGELYLVANRQLPYERILESHLREVECLGARNGFKVIRGKK